MHVSHNFLFCYSVYTLLSRIHFAFLPYVSKSYLIPYCHLLFYNNLFSSVILTIFLLYLMTLCFIFQLFIYLASLFDKNIWEEKYLIKFNLMPNFITFMAPYQNTLLFISPWYLLFLLLLSVTFFFFVSYHTIPFSLKWWFPAAVYHVNTQPPLSEFQGLPKFKSAFSVQLHFFLLPSGNSLH